MESFSAALFQKIYLQVVGFCFCLVKIIPKAVVQIRQTAGTPGAREAESGSRARLSLNFENAAFVLWVECLPVQLASLS